LARNNHINAAAKKYNIDAVELKRLVNSIGSALKIQEENEKIKTELKKTREIKPDAARKNTECLLLNTIIQYKNAYLAIKDVLKPDDFPDGTEQKIYDFICKDYERTGSAVGAGIIDKFEEAEERKKVADILMVSGDFEDTNEDERRKAFADYVTAVKKAAIDRKAGEAMSAGDGERLKALITEEDSLGSLRKKLLSIDLS
jgi:hypothetical protein